MVVVSLCIYGYYFSCVIVVCWHLCFLIYLKKKEKKEKREWHTRKSGTLSKVVRILCNFKVSLQRKAKTDKLVDHNVSLSDGNSPLILYFQGEANRVLFGKKCMIS